MIDMKGGFSHSSSLGATEFDSDRPQDLAKLSDFDLGLVYLTAQQDEQKIP